MTALGFPAYQAILPDLVDGEDLLGASALSMAQFNLGRVVGPALAGVVLVLSSYTWAFALNAASYGAVMVALLFVRLPPPATSEEPPGLWSRISAGARGARAEPGCRDFVALRGTQDPDSFVLYERYESEEAFKAHQASPHFEGIAVAQIRPLLAVRRLEVRRVVEPSG